MTVFVCDYSIPSIHRIDYFKINMHISYTKFVPKPWRNLEEVQKADYFNGWKLQNRLGKGGNGVVFEAKKDRFEGAIKISTHSVAKGQKNPSEPQKRFVKEIQTLKHLNKIKGVMPLLAYPQGDLNDLHALLWFAMPKAIPIKEALKKSSLEAKVIAIIEIANVLISIEKEGFFHRDIKPDNLFLLEQQWTIGDFGLVKHEAFDDLTKSNKKVGPTNYIPHEMLRDPEKSAPGPVDVFCLAKTLWVLATGETWPIPAQLGDSSKRETLIRDDECKELTFWLNSAIYSATEHDPTRRPKMWEFKEALENAIYLHQKGSIFSDKKTFHEFYEPELDLETVRIEKIIEENETYQAFLSLALDRNIEDCTRPIREKVNQAWPLELDFVHPYETISPWEPVYRQIIFDNLITNPSLYRTILCGYDHFPIMIEEPCKDIRKGAWFKACIYYNIEDKEIAAQAILCTGYKNSLKFAHFAASERVSCARENPDLKKFLIPLVIWMTSNIEKALQNFSVLDGKNNMGDENELYKNILKEPLYKEYKEKDDWSEFPF